MNYPARSFTALIDRDEVIDDLAKLVAIPSCSFDGFDIGPSLKCADAVADMVREAGFEDVELLEVGGRAPVVWAEHAADSECYPDAPTLLMYAHYDVQPAPKEQQGWTSDPFELTLKDDGRYYGRGGADDKGGIVAHLHAIEAAGGLEELDYVNLKLCFEGEEECFGTLEEYILEHPQRFAADAYLILDLGNIEVGTPNLITTLRGTVMVDIEIETIAQELHSGAYGGPAPDATGALVQLLATLWDENGDVAIEGLHRFAWEGATYPEDMYRRDIGLVEGADLVGTGPISDQLFARPAVTIIGLDAKSRAEASNVINPRAAARISVRYAPGQDSDEVEAAVIAHLKAHAPAGVAISFPQTSGASAFSTSIDGPLTARFAQALGEVFGVEATAMGSGGSIPLLAALQSASPEADFMLYGIADMAQSNIHGGNESFDPDELINTIKAEATFLHGLGSNTADS